MDCFTTSLGLVSFVLAIIALIRSAKADRLESELGRLESALELMRRKVLALERERGGAPRDSGAEAQAAPAPVQIPAPVPPPVPAPVPHPVPAPVTLPPPALIPEIPAAPRPTPPPPPRPAAPAQAAPAPQVSMPPRPVAASQPQRPLPRVETESSRDLENFMGSQLFLKVGVAILVIGVVFAMGLVFQRMGPLGKVLMGLAGGCAMLAGGLFAERKERYRTFGRGLIAGAWGILYFVSFAAGFIDASRIFQSHAAAVTALLVAATATVVFSLRYRNEWTTTSAFLLIFLSLGIAAWNLQPAYNLSATVVVALGMAVLVWRMGWARLLGLGVPATWAMLGIWSFYAPQGPASAGLLGGLALCWIAFQASMLTSKVEAGTDTWIAMAQVANLVGALGLTLHGTLDGGWAWLWALVYGLAHLAAAWSYARQERRALYLLTATEALGALALVTPLRLGMHNHLTPVMRLLGLEMLLAAGVFLRERYFRALAYLGFAFTLVEILLFRLDPALGGWRSGILISASGVLLLNAGLLRGWWKDACTYEGPRAVWTFSSAGTLLFAIFLWLRVPQPWTGAAFAVAGLVWAALGHRRGLWDLLIQGTLLCGAAFGCCLGGFLGWWDLAALPAMAVAVLLALAFGFIRGTRTRLGAGPGDGTGKAYVAAILSAAQVATTALVLVRHLPMAWAAPSLGAQAILVLLLGLALGYRELVWEALALIPVSVGLLLFQAWPALPVPDTFLSLQPRVLATLLVAACAILQEILFRLRFQKGSEAGPEAQSLGRWGTSLLGTAILLHLVFQEVPAGWVAPVIAGLAVLNLALGLGLRLREHVLVSVLAAALALVAVLTHTWECTGHALGLPLRALSLGIVAAAYLLFEALMRILHRRWPWAEESRLLLGNLTGILGSALLGILAFAEAPSPWVAPSLMGLGFVWMVWARWRPVVHRCFSACAFLAAAFIAVAARSWDLPGGFRAVSVLAALALAYLAQYQFHRAAEEEDADRPLLADLLSRSTLDTLGTVLLAASTLLLGFLVKTEALAHGRDQLVVAAWGLIALFHLERGRNLGSKVWVLCGHAGFAAALLQFLLVNVPAEAAGPVSMRLAMGLPFLALLAYAYLNWKAWDAVFPPESAHRMGRPAYLYGIQLAVAMILLFEPHPAWVLAFWAAQALASLAWGVHRNGSHWLRSALVLAAACVCRGISANLCFRDEFQTVPLNILVVPLTVAMLLLGYVILRKRRESLDSMTLENLGGGLNRLPWFAAQAILLFGFIWVEASGTKLTVWLSLYGLGMVALGFFYQERIARFTGLGMLSACILKLFLYDLRGLSGLPRVLSFIVLGAVLIAVSYAYTRFKERLGGFL